MREQWYVQLYGSGTHVVTTGNIREHAHLNIQGPNGDEKSRYLMCEQLARFLNGEPRPKWLNDMERIAEGQLVGSDGTVIVAAGPFFDADPPKLDWQSHNPDSGARLIDKLNLNEQHSST